MKRLEYKCHKEKDKPFRIEGGHDLKVQLNLVPEGDYTLTVQKDYKKASRRQFGWLYNGIYKPALIALNDAGYEFTTVEEVDIFFKTLFAGRKVLNRETGEIITVPCSKAEFLTIDHMAYVASIRYHCAMYLNCEIPEPDLNWKEHRAKMQILINKNDKAA